MAKSYHQHPHEGLDGQTPLRRWQDGVTALLAEGGSDPGAAGSARIPRGLPAGVAPQPAARRDYDRSSDLFQLRPACLDHGARQDRIHCWSAAIRATSAACSCSIRRMMAIWKCRRATCRGRPSHLGAPPGAAAAAAPAPGRSGRGRSVRGGRGNARGRTRSRAPDPVGTARSRASGRCPGAARRTASGNTVCAGSRRTRHRCFGCGGSHRAVSVRHHRAVVDGHGHGAPPP